MERNRRIAKAYARRRSLTINGSKDEYLDGTSLGLNLFENPDRDSKTRHIKQFIGQGLRIKISQSGDIIVKRLSKVAIYVHKSLSIATGQKDFSRSASNSSTDPYVMNSESGELYGIVSPFQRRPPEQFDEYSNRSAGYQTQIRPKPLELNKPIKIFDMREFKVALERESRRRKPNRKHLQNLCISVISFVVHDDKMLNLPSWIMVINIVAIDLLRSELGLMDLPGQMLAPSYQPGESTIGLQLTNGRQATQLPLRRRALNMIQASAMRTADGKDSSGAQQSGSSSSGFISHSSSSQATDYAGNSSSGLSESSSKQAIGRKSPTDRKPVAQRAASQLNVTKAVDRLTRIEPDGDGLTTRQLAKSCAELASARLVASRGSRPPKLPHRITPGTREDETRRPAVKANLILVAPTGLSPPLAPKDARHAHPQMPGPSWKASSCGQLCELIDATFGPDETPDEQEFSSIRHVNENGELSTLLDRRLPSAIPPHAQLAPPATQRQILRYLLSAAGGHHGADVTTGRVPRPQHRPLPVVPPTSGRDDTSLYYRGLLARVPGAGTRKPMDSQAEASQSEYKKNAIATILSELNGQRLFKKQTGIKDQAAGQNFGQAYSFKSIGSPDEAKNGSSLIKIPKQMKQFAAKKKEQPPRQVNEPKLRPMVKTAKLEADSRVNIAPFEQTKKNVGQFRSVDNLNGSPIEPQRASGSIFAQLTRPKLKFRANKSKKLILETEQPT